MSGTTNCMPWTEPGCISVIPVPIAIEQAEPGGVNCTNRISSLTVWSWSAPKPAWSALARVPFAGPGREQQDDAGVFNRPDLVTLVGVPEGEHPRATTRGRSARIVDLDRAADQ